MIFMNFHNTTHPRVAAFAIAPIKPIDPPPYVSWIFSDARYSPSAFASSTYVESRPEEEPQNTQSFFRLIIIFRVVSLKARLKSTVPLGALVLVVGLVSSFPSRVFFCDEIRF